VAPPAVVDALLQGVHPDSIDARPNGTLPLDADHEDGTLCDAHDEDTGAAVAEFADVAEFVGIQLPRGGLDLKDHLSTIEVGLIRRALKEADGTVAEAARLLRMRRTTLVEKLRKYRLSA
jgi:DNA-binding NtrC family response regulator